MPAISAQRAEHAKAEVVVAKPIRPPLPDGGSRRAEPGAAANGARGAWRGVERIAPRAGLVIVLAEVVGAPLPDIAVQVVKPPEVGRIGADGGRASAVGN